jgi:hypothetical protein
MKTTKRLLLTLAATIGMTGAWAQDTDEVAVTKTANNNEWTLTMPASNIELQVEYYAESNLFLSKDALADKGSIAVTAGETTVEFGDDGKSTNTVTEGNTVTTTKRMVADKGIAFCVILVGKVLKALDIKIHVKELNTILKPFGTFMIPTFPDEFVQLLLMDCPFKPVHKALRDKLHLIAHF